MGGLWSSACRRQSEETGCASHAPSGAPKTVCPSGEADAPQRLKRVRIMSHGDDGSPPDVSLGVISEGFRHFIQRVASVYHGCWFSALEKLFKKVLDISVWPLGGHRDGSLAPGH